MNIPLQFYVALQVSNMKADVVGHKEGLRIAMAIQHIIKQLGISWIDASLKS